MEKVAPHHGDYTSTYRKDTMTDLDALARLVATTLGITDDAARYTLETYIHQTEREAGDIIDPDAITDDDAAFLMRSCQEAQRSGDLGERQLAHLENIARYYDEIYTDFQSVEQQRLHAIKDALNHGARVVDICTITGISRARVYRIKDGI